MVVDAVVYDNWLRRGSPRRAPVITGTNVKAFVDEEALPGRGSLLKTWFGSPTVVQTDMNVVPIVVTAAVTHRELDSDKRDFLWVLIEMKRDSRRSTI